MGAGSALAVNLSDLAASGADPLALLVSLGLPAETELEDVLELYAGLNERGVPVRGGDTTRADRVLLSVTALGRAERVPGRAGARPGDAVVVTAPLGAAGAAFRAGKLPQVGWEKIVDHIDHAAGIAGADHVGVGSDFDGAFMPAGMEDASKFPHITEGLLLRGYGEADIRKILGENTLRVMADAERVGDAFREEKS